MVPPFSPHTPLYPPPYLPLTRDEDEDDAALTRRFHAA